MSQPLLSTPSKNATSSHSQAGNEKYQQTDIKGILDADTKKSKQCGIDALLKYFLSITLKPDCPKRLELDKLQAQIEDLQFHRYYGRSQTGEADAATAMGNDIASTSQTLNQSTGIGDGKNIQDNNDAESGTKEERELVQQREKILNELFASTLKAVVPIANNKEIVKKRNAFGYAFTGKETGLYAPFVHMCNDALERLGSRSLASTADCAFREKDRLDIHFYRNDPMPIRSKFDYPKGSMIDRKPDIGITSLVVAQRHYTQENPRDFREAPITALEWPDLLLAAEFKKRSNQIPEAAKEFNHAPYRFDDPLETTDRDTFEKMDIEYPVKGPDAKRRHDSDEGVEDNIDNGSPKKKMRPLNSESQGSKPTSNRTISVNPGTLNSGDGNHRPPTVLTTNGRVQCASYALEMFSYSAGVHHVINLLFIDNYLWIWYYDRQGILQSDGMCIFKNFPRFLVLLFALQRFNLEDWGIVSSLNPKAIRAHRPNDEMNVGQHDGDFVLNLDQNSSLLNPQIFDEKIRTVKVQMSKPLSIQPHCLAGRATSVVTAVGVTENDLVSTLIPTMVCKISHPEVQRRHEGTTIQVIRQIATDNNADMLKHLPNLIFYGDIQGSSTERIRSMVGRTWKGHRTLRIIVMKKLERITTVEGAEFIKAWLDTVICHAFLWKHYVEHGDPSLNNIMYDPETGCGVLCDYDLSLLQWEPHIIGTERTGTVPFMALELLCDDYWDGKIRRYYHHELESFIWILTYVCLLYDDGKRKPNSFVDSWRTSDYNQCFEKKAAFYSTFILVKACKTVQPAYGEYRILVQMLCRALRVCHGVDPAEWTQPAPLSQSTYLWDKFRDTLSQYLQQTIFRDQLTRLLDVKPSFEPPMGDKC